MIKLIGVRIQFCIFFFSNLKYSNIYIFYNLIWISFKTFSVFLLCPGFFCFLFSFYFYLFIFFFFFLVLF